MKGGGGGINSVSMFRDIPLGECDNFSKVRSPPQNEITLSSGAAHMAKDIPLAFNYHFISQGVQKKAPGTGGGAIASYGPQAQSSSAV